MRLLIDRCKIKKQLWDMRLLILHRGVRRRTGSGQLLGTNHRIEQALRSLCSCKGFTSLFACQVPPDGLICHRQKQAHRVFIRSRQHAAPGMRRAPAVLSVTATAAAWEEMMQPRVKDAAASPKAQ